MLWSKKGVNQLPGRLTGVRRIEQRVAERQKDGQTWRCMQMGSREGKWEGSGKRMREKLDVAAICL